MTTALEVVWGQHHAPGRSLPPGKSRYPLYRRLGGPQGRSEQVRNILPQPGFDPRTVQPVASRYTDWATRCTHSSTHYFFYITTLPHVGIYQTEFIPAQGLEIKGTDGLTERCGVLLGISFSCFCEKDLSNRKHKTSGSTVMSLLSDVRCEQSDTFKLFDVRNPHAESAVCGAITNSVLTYT